MLEDFGRIQDAANLAVKESTGTNLWDSVILALESMQKTETGVQDSKGNHILRFLVVFTDGEDNTSTPGSFYQMVNNVKKPGMGSFHFKSIVVGAPQMAQVMQQAFQVYTDDGSYRILGLNGANYVLRQGNIIIMQLMHEH